MNLLNKNNIIMGSLSVLLLASIISALYFYFDKEECICSNELLLNDEIKEYNSIKVEVKGEVKNVGVYEVDEEKRIIDVIEMAGGFTSNAYSDNINLSMKVSDELVIFVSSKSDVKKGTTNKWSNTISNINSEDSKESENELININTASKKELMNLPGIGESKANAIISYRNKNGNFKNISDIKNVSGIGSGIYEKFKNNICV